MKAVARLKKWGNSFGIVIPKDLVEEMGLRESEELVFEISKAGKSEALIKSWGLCKDEKRTAQEIKDELRRTLYREDF